MIALEELAERSNGDIRMAINQLQYMSLSMSSIKYEDIKEHLNSRSKDEDVSPFSAVDKVIGFNGGKLRMDERIDLSMSDPDLVPLLIQENYVDYKPSGVMKDDNGLKRMNLIALLLKPLAEPLRSLPKDEAVRKVVDFMDHYSINQEDFNTIMELSKDKGYPNPLDGIQPTVKSALTKAYKEGSSSRAAKTSDLITLPGIKMTPKKRIAAILEPAEEVAEENAALGAESEDEVTSDTEDTEEGGDGGKKLRVDLESNHANDIPSANSAGRGRGGRGATSASAGGRGVMNFGERKDLPNKGMKGIQIMSIILVLTTLCSLYTSEAASCHRTRLPPVNRPRVVLVHGFASGAWTWFRAIPILSSLGFPITTINMLSSGTDITPISKLETFQDYNEPLERLMAGLPRNEKVVLVGHNVAGLSLTRTLHRYADKVHVAVYISAAMLKYGYLSCDDLQIGLPGFTESRCNASCPSLPDPTCFAEALIEPLVTPLNNLIEYHYYHSLRKLVQRPGPYRIIATANLTEDTEGSAADKVPRIFIKTSMDTVFTPTMQDAMISRWPPCEVIEVENGHDILFEEPGLISALIANATSYAHVN